MHSEFLHYHPCTRVAEYSCRPKGSSTMCAEQGSLVILAVIQTKNIEEIPWFSPMTIVIGILLSKHNDSLKITWGVKKINLGPLFKTSAFSSWKYNF